MDSKSRKLGLARTLSVQPKLKGKVGRPSKNARTAVSRTKSAPLTQPLLPHLASNLHFHRGLNAELSPFTTRRPDFAGSDCSLATSASGLRNEGEEDSEEEEEAASPFPSEERESIDEDVESLCHNASALFRLSLLSRIGERKAAEEAAENAEERTRRGDDAAAEPEVEKVAGNVIISLIF